MPSGRFSFGDLAVKVAVGEVAGRGCGLALVGAVPASSRHVRRQTVLGHDPADHLLRDAGSERGLDPAVPVPALGRGERLRHLRPESCVLVNGEPGVVYWQLLGAMPSKYVIELS